MKIGRFKIHPPHGSMGCIAEWSYVTGYWRWALYWSSACKGFGIQRTKNITGSNYPHFGLSVLTPLGTLRLATQPPMPSMKNYERIK